MFLDVTCAAFSEHLGRTWVEKRGRTSHSQCVYIALTSRLRMSGCVYDTVFDVAYVASEWYVLTTCLQRSSPCDCHVNVMFSVAAGIYKTTQKSQLPLP